MKILVTGAAGFIGFHTCLQLVNLGHEVYGIDNINDYYDTNLKYARLEILKKYNNFSFEKIDISNKDKITQSFLKFKPKKVINLAAQAGVRYSIKNPYTYIKTNIQGFLNVIELCRHNNVKGLIYASSSSVYGGNTKIPFSVTDTTDSPVSLYAATKKSNELIAHCYSSLYGLHTTGLRYFTVYGPWGRPDMAYYKFTNNIINDKTIEIFNHGKMKRDFTYIDDIINGTKSAIKNNYKCEIFNLGNNKTQELMRLVELLEKNLNKKAIIKMESMQLGDVKKTYADIRSAEELLGYKPSINLEDGIKLFTDWYKEYYNNQISTSI